MTGTNRFANRLLLFLSGLILLLCGLGAVAVALIPALTAAWNRNAPDALARAESLLRSPAVPGTDISWVLTGAFAVLVVLVVLLVVFIVTQGHGQTRDLLIRQTGENGTTIIEAQLAAELLHDGLAGEPEILASRVTAYNIRGIAALRVTVSCRRGASPTNISTRVEGLIVALDELLGIDVPTLVQITGGFRTMLSASTRLDRTAPAPDTAPATTNALATAVVNE